MTERIGVVGVGFEGFRPAVTDISTRELMFQAASKAYADAGVDPRKDVGSFICCTEDLWEGWSIADEMVPDQIGGARRPLCTVAGEGIVGIGHAMMHIASGVADVVAVEAHSKAADVLDKTAVENLSLDPVMLRVPGANYDVLAGLEMSGFMAKSGIGRTEISRAVMLEMEAALKNYRSSYGASLGVEEVNESEPVSLPLRSFDKPQSVDGGIVLVLAGERWIRKHRKDAVYVDGLEWRSSTPWYESGDIGTAGYARDTVGGVLRRSGRRGLSSFDIMEVDDTYSYKLVQHLISMGMTRKQLLEVLESKDGFLNPSGGSLGTGYLIEATGLWRVLECVLQLRGEAGGNQVKGASKALAVSWRGHPTATGAAVALSGEA